jgi:alpha-galactosidase
MVLAPTGVGLATPQISDIERDTARRWVETNFGEQRSAIPFSFRFGARDGAPMLEQLGSTYQQLALDENRTQHELLFKDPDTKLEVRCVAIEYHDFPVIEWTVFIRNRAVQSTPVVAAMRALDVALRTPPPITGPRHALRSWNAGNEIGLSPVGDQRVWRYSHRRKGVWQALDQYDSSTHAGLERRLAGDAAAPWVGKVVSAEAIELDGVVVPAQSLLVQPADDSQTAMADGMSGTAFAWTCPATGYYQMDGRVQNVGIGGDGVAWQFFDRDGNEIEEGIVGDQQIGRFQFETQQLNLGDQLRLAISSRGDADGDLSLVDLNVRQVSTPVAGDLVVRFSRGSGAGRGDFEPIEWGLPDGGTYEFEPVGGRPSQGPALPYFNVAGAEGGVLIGVGWPGQWQARVARQGNQLHLHAGLQALYCSLTPSEEIRSPRVVMQFYRGDSQRAQNIWRQWVLRHNLPRPEGQPLRPQLSASSFHQVQPLRDANQYNQQYFINRYLEEQIPLDGWSIDEGWYQHNSQEPDAQSWAVHPERFPDGLPFVTQHARELGVATALRCEPERVAEGSWLYETRKNWLLQPTGLPSELADQSAWRMLYLGRRAPRQWLTDHVDQLIKSAGIDRYRHAMNFDPLYFWRAGDDPKQRGATENHHIAGYLAFLDELVGLNPALVVDSCAGGGRCDLETLRRSVPLECSDQFFDPIAMQCHTFGMASWIPYWGSGTMLSGEYRDELRDGTAAVAPSATNDTYLFRSQMGPHLTAYWDVNNRGLDWSLRRKLIADWQRVAPFYLADFYPLTEFSAADHAWMAWQFHDDQQQAGMIQAFRRPRAVDEFLTVQLAALDPDGDYTFTNLDTGDDTVHRGADLNRAGLRLTIGNQPGSALFVYRRMDPPLIDNVE